MTFEELKIQLDLNEPIDILKSIGKQTDDDNWFVICDEGDCHLFDNDGNDIDIKKIKSLYEKIIPKDIKKIIVPDSIESIRNDAFFSCINLTSINGHHTFSYCKSLTSIIIPNSIKHIGDSAFAYCKNLTSINIPDSVKSIGYDAFYDCLNLKSIIFKGKTIDQIKSMNFYTWGIKDESIIKCIG